MIGRIEQRIDFRNGHALSRLSDFNDFVARTHRAFTQHPEVEPWPTAGCQQCRHPRLVHSNTDPIAGNTRLSDLEECATDLITVANAYGIVSQPFDREIFSELTVDEVSPLQMLLPVVMRFYLINEDSSLLTAVPSQVTLTVSLDIQPADATPTMHWILPDPGVHSATLPLDVARKSHVHR
jgi:hypothetical protein